MPGSCATKKNLQRGRKYQTKESLSVPPFKWNITLNLPVIHRGFLVHARVECTYQGKLRWTTHREPIPLRPSLPIKWVLSFFLFFQFFRQTRAEKLTIQAISGESGKFSNRLWGHDWKFWNSWSYKFDSFKGIIPALRDSKNFWIKRYTHLYKFVADFHARFLVFFFIICRLIYQFVGLSLFVGRLWFAHRVTYSYLIRSYEDVKGYFRWRLATQIPAHEWICTGRRQNRIRVFFNVVIVNWN